MLAGVFVPLPLPLANGARMPSTADDDCAEMRKVAFRAAPDLRWGLDCFSVMLQMIRLK